MEKIEEVVIIEEHDIPEVRRNKELMAKFEHDGDVYQKGKESFDMECQIEELDRKAGLAPKPAKVHFSDDKEDFLIGVSAYGLNKMYEEMTYEDALRLLQTIHTLKTSDKNNKTATNLYSSLGREFGWRIDLALLRIEEWNHAHRALAGRVALAIVDEDENKKTSPEPKKQTKVKSVLTKGVTEGKVQERAKERKRMSLA